MCCKITYTAIIGGLGDVFERYSNIRKLSFELLANGKIDI